MYVDEATRKDDGVYQINAVNIHGKDAAEVRVYVLGPPGPPEGPMDITGIHKNGCKIAWKPPKDDGGAPIEHYIVEKYDVDTGIWSLVGTSPTCDITCNDLEPGKEYEFRVRAVNSEGESENLKSLKPIVAKDPFTVPLPPSVPEVVDWSESHMALEWKDVDLGRAPGHLVVRRSEWRGHVTTPKGNASRRVPLTRRLGSALRQAKHLRGARILCNPDGSPLTQKVVQGLVHRSTRKALLAKSGVHLLRHTFCSQRLV